MFQPYPEEPAVRDKWILARRGSRNIVDPWKAHGAVVEEELSASGELVGSITLFLTNRECPWRCLMCDLWQNTLATTVPSGAIPHQITQALANLPGAPQLKLYNSGSFFDPRAIPPEDYPSIAQAVRSFERVIVECHPALVKEPVLRFRDLLEGQLEVAMGLETVHPEVLPRLNKRMTLDQFARAAAFLTANAIALRAFILLKPPFLQEAEAVEWASRSIEFAFDCGASVAVIIPTRSGNGSLDALAGQGLFAPPRLASLEEVLDYGVSLRRGRVFADLWDIEKFSDCTTCFDKRRLRLAEMNRAQRILPVVSCDSCKAD